MSAQLFHFDDHHPAHGDHDFGTREDAALSVQVFRGGRYLGYVRSVDGETWDSEWRSIGRFQTVDAATAALIAEAADH